MSEQAREHHEFTIKGALSCTLTLTVGLDGTIDEISVRMPPGASEVEKFAYVRALSWVSFEVDRTKAEGGMVQDAVDRTPADSVVCELERNLLIAIANWQFNMAAGDLARVGMA